MVCVVQNKGNTQRFNLLWGQAFDCCLRRHGHECRKHCDTVFEQDRLSLTIYLSDKNLTYEQAPFCKLGLLLCGILQRLEIAYFEATLKIAG